MAHKSEHAIELPNRNEISLCEAVTAVLLGVAHDLRQYQNPVEEELSEEQSAFFGDLASIPERIACAKQTRGNVEAEHFLERLSEAAYAGHIKFRAVKEYGDPADGFQEIDPLYFHRKPVFNWPQDTIFHENGEPWYFVHLDRKQFEAFIEGIGLHLKQHDDADEGTGLPGRPNSSHIVIAEAQRRLDEGKYPETIAAFGRELANWFCACHPQKAPLRPRSIENAVRELWHIRRIKTCTK